MSTKVRELDNRKDGDRSQCPICTPPRKRGMVKLDRVWAWSLKHGGSPFK